MNVFELFASLTLDSSEYDQGLNNAEQEASSFGSSIAKGLGTAATVGGAALTAVGTAATAVTGALVSSTMATAEYGDNIDKMSQKLGISAEAYQEWDAVLQHSGTSIESMSATFKTLANAAQDASADQVAAFEAIGLSMDDVAGMATEDLFAAVINGLQGMEEGTERTAYATDLLGRGAMEMGALLNTSAEDTQAMIDRVHELGGVLSDEAVKDAAGFQDSLQDMQTAFDGLKRGLMSEMLPSITQVMDGLANIFAGDEELGLSQVGEGIDAFIEKMGDILPRIVEIGSGIIQSLASAFVENLPKLFSVISNSLKDVAAFLPGFIDSVINALVVLLPDAMQTIIDVVVSLINGLSEVIPDLIPAIVTMLTSLVQVIIDNANILIDAAFGLINALLEGIFEAVPALTAAMPQLITSLLTAFLRAVTQMTEGGVDIVLTILDGFNEALPDLLDMVAQLIPQVVFTILELSPELIAMSFEIFNTLIQGLAENLPRLIVEIVKSVGQCSETVRQTFLDYDWLTLGKNIIQGIIDGIVSMVGAVGSAVSTVADSVIDGFKSIFDIHSPSRVMRDEIGKMLALGLGEGFEENAPDLQGMVDDMMVEPRLALSAEGIGGINLAAGLNGIQLIAPVYIGQTLIDEVITDATVRQAYTSGGR